MSALPPKADIAKHECHVRFVPKADIRLFDHLIGEHEEVVWHFDPERPGGFEIDDEFEFGRLLDRDVAGLGPAQNLIDELGGTPKQAWIACPIAEQKACSGTAAAAGAVHR